MKETIRELTIEGESGWRVSNLCGILNPGKFEGDWPHAVRDYNLPNDEDAGDVNEFGIYAWRVGHRYYLENGVGFVSEILRDEFESIERDYAAFCDRQEELELLGSQLETMREEERGACDSCAVAYVNGVRCHEQGCPREARLYELERRIVHLESI